MAKGDRVTNREVLERALGALQGIARFYAFQLESARALTAKHDVRLLPVVARIVGQSSLRYARWIAHVHLGRSVHGRSDATCTVVLLSYKRPANMDMQVRSALKCSFVERVIVCNNNPEIKISDWVKVRDPRIHLLDRSVRTGPGMRIALAATSETEFVLSFDDDAFHSPTQLAALFEALVADPSVVHGTEGEVRIPGKILTSSDSNYPFECGRKGMRCEVDAVTQGYAFTRTHAHRCLELFRLLGMPEPEAIFNGEDLTLSASGDGKPRLEDIGAFAECLSCFADDKALNRVPGFFAARVELYRKLEKMHSERRQRKNGRSEELSGT